MSKTRFLPISIFQITNYPNLREIIENNIISFIHNNGPKYKKCTLSLIEMQLAYMNIKHEEFMKNMYVSHNKHSTYDFTFGILIFFLFSLYKSIVRSKVQVKVKMPPKKVSNKRHSV